MRSWFLDGASGVPAPPPSKLGSMTFGRQKMNGKIPQNSPGRKQFGLQCWLLWDPHILGTLNDNWRRRLWVTQPLLKCWLILDKRVYILKPLFFLENRHNHNNHRITMILLIFVNLSLVLMSLERGYGELLGTYPAYTLFRVLFEVEQISKSKSLSTYWPQYV